MSEVTRSASQRAAPACGLQLLDLTDDCLGLVLARLVPPGSPPCGCELARASRRLARVSLRASRSLCIPASGGVGAALALSPALRALTVTDNAAACRWYERSRLATIAPLVPAMPSLVSLSLCAHPARRPGVARTLDLLFGLPARGSLPRDLAAAMPARALTSLDLEACFALGDDMQRFGRVALQLPALSRLALRGNAMSCKAAPTLGAALARMPVLADLDLSHNPLHVEGLTSLVTALRALPKLTRLDLSDTLPASQVWRETFGPRTRRVPPLDALTSLQSLSLAHNAFTPPQFAALAALLPRLPRLRALSLSHVGLADNVLDTHSVSSLATALASILPLEHLDLSGNSLDEPDLDALLPCLAALPSLRSLDLSRNSVPHDAVTPLTATLPSFPALQLLDLSDNRLKTRASHDLLVFLAAARSADPDATALQWLGLAGNGITAAGAEYCVSAHGPDVGDLTVDLYGDSVPEYNKAGDAVRAAALRRECTRELHPTRTCRACCKLAALRLQRRSKASTCMVK